MRFPKGNNSSRTIFPEMQNGSSTPPQVAQQRVRPHQVAGNPVEVGPGSRYIRNLTATLPDFGLDKYIPDALKDFAAGGADVRADSLHKERITFAKIETLPRCGEENEKQILMLGYVNGFQLWDVSQQSDSNAPAEMVQEILSVRDSSVVKSMHLLAQPEKRESSDPVAQTLASARPLLALTSALDTPAFPVSIVKLYSIKLQCYAHELRFKSRVLTVKSSPSLVVVAIEDAVYAFCAHTLQHQFGLSCYPSPTLDAPIDLGTRWIAYAGTGDDKHSSLLSESKQDTWSVSAVAKDVTNGLYYLGELGKSRVSQYWNSTGSASGSPQRMEFGRYGMDSSPTDVNSTDSASEHSSGKQSVGGSSPGCTPTGVPGVVEVRDVVTHQVVAQFRSHSTAMSVMQFSPSGSLLATCSVEGQTIHVHKITPRTSQDLDLDSSRDHVLLYKLDRGITPTLVRDISFSLDQSWVAVTSQRGTTHLFPITVVGGKISVFTHSVAAAPEERSGAGGSLWHSIAPGRVTTAAVALSKQWIGGSGNPPPVDQAPVDLDTQEDSLAASYQELDKEEFESRLPRQEPHAVHSSAKAKSPERDHLPASALHAPAYLAAMHEKNMKTEKLSALARVRSSVSPSAPFPVPRHLKPGSWSSASSVSSTPRAHSRSAGYIDSRSYPPHGAAGLPQDAVRPGSYESAASAYLDMAQLDSSSVNAATLAYWEPVERLPVTVSTCFVGNKLLSVSCAGEVTKYTLSPVRHMTNGQTSRNMQRNPNKVALRTQFVQSWDVCRRSTWPVLCAPHMLQSHTRPAIAGTPDEPLSKVELRTHRKLDVPLWSMPQFRFCTYDSKAMKGGRSVFAGEISGTPIELRDCGPSATIPSEKKQEGTKRSTSSGGSSKKTLERSTTTAGNKEPRKTMLFDLQTAIATPVQFNKTQKEILLSEKANGDEVPVFSWDDEAEGFDVDVVQEVTASSRK